MWRSSGFAAGHHPEKLTSCPGLGEWAADEEICLRTEDECSSYASLLWEGWNRRAKAAQQSWGKLADVPGVQPVPHLVGNRGTTAAETS